ncbi:MAG: hypothetical protein ABIQ49_02280 [Gemmatimonadales bacterium]
MPYVEGGSLRDRLRHPRRSSLQIAEALRLPLATVVHIQRRLGLRRLAVLDLMRDIQSTFTERFLKLQVSAERPEPPRAPLPPPTAIAHQSSPTSGADDLFSGPPPRVAPPPPVAPGGPAPVLTSSHGLLARATAAVPEWGGTTRVPGGRGRSTRSITGWGGSSAAPNPRRIVSLEALR